MLREGWRVMARGHIWSTTCFCVASNLRITFIFLKSEATQIRHVTCESYIHFLRSVQLR